MAAKQASTCRAAKPKFQNKLRTYGQQPLNDFIAPKLSDLRHDYVQLFLGLLSTPLLLDQCGICLVQSLFALDGVFCGEVVIIPDSL